jgi:hypothetical protein
VGTSSAAATPSAAAAAAAAPGQGVYSGHSPVSSIPGSPSRLSAAGGLPPKPPAGVTRASVINPLSVDGGGSFRGAPAHRPPSPGRARMGGGAGDAGGYGGEGRRLGRAPSRLGGGGVQPLQRAQRSQFESLDYEVVENTVYRAEYAGTTHLDHIWRSGAKWSMCFFLGELTFDCRITTWIARSE